MTLYPKLIMDALATVRYKVGLLDADIFGPSVPKMFQVEDARPYAEEVGGRDLIVPVEKYGLVSSGRTSGKQILPVW